MRRRSWRCCGAWRGSSRKSRRRPCPASHRSSRSIIAGRFPGGGGLPRVGRAPSASTCWSGWKTNWRSGRPRRRADAFSPKLVSLLGCDRRLTEVGALGWRRVEVAGRTRRRAVASGGSSRARQPPHGKKHRPDQKQLLPFAGLAGLSRRIDAMTRSTNGCGMPGSTARAPGPGSGERRPDPAERAPGGKTGGDVKPGDVLTLPQRREIIVVRVLGWPRGAAQPRSPVLYEIRGRNPRLIAPRGP